MSLTNVTIALPRDWSELLQKIANEETDGNKSAVIRELLLLKFDQHGFVPCECCGKLVPVDELEKNEEFGEMRCSECLHIPF